MLVLPEFCEITVTQQLANLINVTEVSQFKGHIELTLSRNNKEHVRLSFGIDKAFLTFKRDSYILFSRSLRSIVASFKKENESPVEQEEDDLNSEFFIESSSKY